MPLLQIFEAQVVVGVLLAGEPIHPNAGIHQVHSEWRCSHRGSVADECFWIAPFAGSGSCRPIPGLVGEPAICITKIRLRNTAASCLKEIL